MDPFSQRSANGALSYTSRMIQADKYPPSSLKCPTERGGGGPGGPVDPTHLTNGSQTNGTGSAKSFIEQRIERLYGPAALGMAFRVKRAQLERYSTSSPCSTTAIVNKSVDEARSILESEEGETPPGLPSVFKHLRPEFRHQLPAVKNRRSLGTTGRSDSTPDSGISLRNGSSPIENGHKVRYIPIQLETDSKDVPDRKLDIKNETSMIKLNRPKADQATIKEKDVVEQINRIDLRTNVDTKSSSKVKPISSEFSNSSTKESEIIKDGHYFLKVKILRIYI